MRVAVHIARKAKDAESYGCSDLVAEPEEGLLEELFTETMVFEQVRPAYRYCNRVRAETFASLPSPDWTASRHLL